jgi:hypothetical protein
VAFVGHTFYEEETAAYAADEDHAVLDAALIRLKRIYNF